MLATGKRESLKKGLLDFRKLKDVNFETHNEGAVIRYWRHSEKFFLRPKMLLISGAD